ncbi:ribonuclease Z [Marinobacter nauticus]|uniref:Ribonuclease Z n=1 Tax=Marinobacter nauticus (strain ATCC 700491 / DSM 11845 / VT8) TaxID=351348 RepID=RNZ_MARN8|nr:ribonuclease Z [Marinobacter nauticus]A1U2M9.1 RecName: Full=Ribonuclease Z; Short=RNase Z; AltName: Full=tRNA 3 endonuclease; AltName: Full=tRNase Z [Marinobacter nauticus VT8]ABM19248.1 RNAse Z [Marinobacter nauticus VT8]
MEFTFLGTSAGTPTRSRNVTGLALCLSGPKPWYLVDCGEGTQHQLMRTRYSVMQLRAMFITHIHGDHIFGLPGLLTSASMLGRTEPLDIIAPPQVRRFIDAVIENSDSSLSYPLNFINSEAPDFYWQDDHLGVTNVALSHRVPCRAYVFTERNLERQLQKEKLVADGIEPGPQWGDLQKGKDVLLDDGRLLRSNDYTHIPRTARKIIVGGDNDTPELLKDACQGTHVLIHEATYTQDVADRVGPWPQHSSAQQVARFAQATKLPNLVLTHFSSRYQSAPGGSPHINQLAAEALQHYKGQLFLARDFDTYRLEKDFQLHKVDHN